MAETGTTTRTTTVRLAMIAVEDVVDVEGTEAVAVEDMEAETGRRTTRMTTAECGSDWGKAG